MGPTWLEGWDKKHNEKEFNIVMSLSRMNTISVLIMATRRKYQDETSMHFTDGRQGENRRNRHLIKVIASF